MLYIRSPEMYRLGISARIKYSLFLTCGRIIVYEICPYRCQGACFARDSNTSDHRTRDICTLHPTSTVFPSMTYALFYEEVHNPYVSLNSRPIRIIK
jgi:hypothetical protein